MAAALQAPAPKLNEAQAPKASKVAMPSLAWASTDDEGAEWAETLVTLPHAAPDRDQVLTAAIAYPTTAGSATGILLEAIRAGHPDAPAKEKGTEVALEWLANTFPDVLSPPRCLPPATRPQMSPAGSGADRALKSPNSQLRQSMFCRPNCGDCNSAFRPVPVTLEPPPVEFAA